MLLAVATSELWVDPRLDESDDVVTAESALIVVDALKGADTFADAKVGSAELLAVFELLPASALDVRPLVVPVSLGVWPASDESLVTDADTLAGVLELETAVLWSALLTST